MMIARSYRCPQELPMDDPLVETWTIHDRINRYLLDAIAE
jgi:hypothetical protein